MERVELVEDRQRGLPHSLAGGLHHLDGLLAVHAGGRCGRREYVLKISASTSMNHGYFKTNWSALSCPRAKAAYPCFLT